MDEKGKILLALDPARVPPGAADRIRAAGGGRDVILASGADEIVGQLAGVEIAAGEFPPSLIEKAPDLRWFQLWYAGADWIQKFPKVAELPVTVSTASGIHYEQMTEHLFGLIFAWNRKFPVAFAAQERKEWAKFKHSDMAVLAGRTMLILGYGTIGERVAKIAQAFGMRVIGVRRSRPESEVDALGVRVVSLDALSSVLGEGDVVVNILPATAETKGFCGGQFFDAMKSGALYANIGRGATTDESALVAALRSGSIAGAVLDVASQEPLPSSSELWDAPNLILTSHYAGFHPRYDEMALGFFLENLGRYVRGEPLRNVVDKKLGY